VVPLGSDAEEGDGGGGEEHGADERRLGEEAARDGVREHAEKHGEEGGGAEEIRHL
jgi:hypothetical protein